MPVYLRIKTSVLPQVSQGIVVSLTLWAGWENLWQRDLRFAQGLRLHGYA